MTAETTTQQPTETTEPMVTAEELRARIAQTETNLAAYQAERAEAEAAMLDRSLTKAARRAAMDQLDRADDAMEAAQAALALDRPAYEAAAKLALAPLETKLQELIGIRNTTTAAARAAEAPDRPALVDAAVDAFRAMLGCQIEVDAARRGAGLKVAGQRTGGGAAGGSAPKDGSAKRAGGVLYRRANGDLHHKVGGEGWSELAPIFADAGIKPAGHDREVTWGGRKGSRYLDFSADQVAKLIPALERAITAGGDDHMQPETGGNATRAARILLNRARRFEAGEAGDTI